MYNNDFDNSDNNSEYDNVNTFTLKKTTSYVTKKAFVLLLILTLILGTGIGYLIRDTLNSQNGLTDFLQISNTNYSLDEATDSELSIQQIIAKNKNSVVEISTESASTDSWLGSYIMEGAGSGIIVRSNGYIVTNNHVIEGSNKTTVTLLSGKNYEATLVGTDPSNDLAILKIDATNLDPVNFGNIDDLVVGDLSVAIGNPLGELGGTATTGIISSLDRAINIDGLTLDLIQTDAAINPGNSGGGLFNQHGELIGIVIAKSGGTDTEGLGFAIPINTAQPIIEDLIANGKISNRPIAGITIVDIDTEEAASQFGTSELGVYIIEITGANAKKSGLKTGDQVSYLNELPIVSSYQLIKEIQKYKIGEKVKFTITRDGKKTDVTLALEDASDYTN
ncbi:MAG: trypsin-like peptidase domain-containing protein [Peptostreptococcaceae bacterium]|nr:trypsin-like peptidase domain-containing protein [Peptostreptococcaceae bacterium]